MEKMQDILLTDVERLQEVKEDILSARCSISDSNMEMTSSEHEEMKQINNLLFEFSEMIQAIIDRKEDKIQILIEQEELQSQIYNQE